MAIKENVPIKYTSRDFATIKRDLVEYTKKYYPDTFKDFNEASFGALVLDSVSYVGDVLSFYMDYQANETAWSDLIKDSKVKEINDLEGRLQSFQTNAQQSLTTKEQSLIEPVIKKAQDAIDTVAKANGYTYVFDTSVGAVLVYPDGDNMLGLVKKHLGIL